MDTGVVAGGLVILALLAVIFMGIPIASCLMVVGVVGYVIMRGWDIGMSFLSMSAYGAIQSFTFMCIPLFILMGFIAAEGKFIADAYEASKRWLSRLPGGLAVTTTAACALFAAVSGSSAASAAAMGVISYPEMRKGNYNPGYAASSIAISGTLAIMIPPSLGFILYGIILNIPIPQLFIAGILPGILLALIIMTILIVEAKIKPEWAPKLAETFSLKQKVFGTKGIIPILLLFAVVIGGMYTGFFTVSEAAAVGCFAAIVLTLAMRRLSGKGMVRILKDMVPTTGMLFLVILGALILSNMMLISGIGNSMGKWVLGLNVSKGGALIAITCVYLVLGMMMDASGMTMITLPIFAPIIRAMGFDLIWFTIFGTLMSEACLITPPVGLNVFVLGGTVKGDCTLNEIFGKVLLLLPAILLTEVIIFFFPQIVLILPNLMYR